MIVIPSFVIAAQVPTPVQILDRAIAAHAAYRTGAVRVSVDTRGAGAAAARTDFGVSFGAQAITLRVQEPPRAGVGRSDRTYQVVGGLFKAWDSGTNETVSQKVGTKGPLFDRLNSVVGSLEDSAVQFFAVPAASRTLLNRFRVLPGFQVTRNGKGYAIARRTAVNGQTSLSYLAFDGNYRLTEFLVQAPGGSRLQWKVTYGSPTTLKVPPDARKVSSFTVAPESPIYASKEAQRITEGMFSAYRKLRRARIVVKTGGATVKLAVSERFFSEEQANRAWAFDGTKFALRQDGRFYEGPIKRPEIADAAALVSSGVDPLMRSLIFRLIPYRESYRADTRVKLMGVLKVDGVLCDIVEAQGAGLRLTSFVRQDNHLLSSVFSETLDRSGNVTRRAERKFSYSGVGQLIPKSAFVLTPRPGERRQPLPKIS